MLWSPGAAGSRDNIIRFGCAPAGSPSTAALQRRVAMLDIKKRLQDEITKLDYELKVTLPKEILRAREHGDLRENAEYKSAKERQSFLQARVAQLHRRLAALSMVNLDRIPHDKVGLGSMVTVKHEDT